MPDDIIKVKLPQLPPLEGDAQADDKIFLYDSSAGILKQALVSQLPAGSGGGGGSGDGSIVQSAKFKVRVTSTLNPKYEYDEETNSTTITDGRLVGKTDYTVSTTQIGGGEFRDASLVYDADAGTVTISDFKLDLGEHITIDVNSAANSVYDDILSEINLLKLMAGPFMPTLSGANGGKVWWPSTLAIPAGWQECEAMRGYLPMAKSPSDSDFNKTHGSTVGSKTHKVDSVDKLPKHRFLTIVDETIAIGEFPYNNGRLPSGTKSMIWNWSKTGTGKESYVLYGQAGNAASTPPTLSPTNYIGKDTPDDINHMNPCLIGIWIEFIGV